MEKTIKEWFEEVEEPYRTQLLTNADAGGLEYKTSSLEDALFGAFYWHQTPEGWQYWENYRLSIKDKNADS